MKSACITSSRWTHLAKISSPSAVPRQTRVHPGAQSRASPKAQHPKNQLDAELGAAPVTALGVVPDGVTGAHADPLGNGAVLLLLLAQDLLGLEGFLGRLLGGRDGGLEMGTMKCSQKSQTLTRDEMSEYRETWPMRRREMETGVASIVVVL